MAGAGSKVWRCAAWSSPTTTSHPRPLGFTWEPGKWVTDQSQIWKNHHLRCRQRTQRIEGDHRCRSGPAGIAAALFEPLAAANVNIDMIVQNTSHDGTTDISFTMPKADMATAESIVSRVAADVGARGVDHDADIAKISLVGAGMKTSPGIAAKMFRVLADEKVNIAMISTSTIRISVVTAAADLERAARALHTAFGLDSGQAYSSPLPERKVAQPMRRNHVPWRAAGTKTEKKHSADEVVREKRWVFNNVTGRTSACRVRRDRQSRDARLPDCLGFGTTLWRPRPSSRSDRGSGRMTSSFTRLFGRVVACDLDAASWSGAGDGRSVSADPSGFRRAPSATGTPSRCRTPPQISRSATYVQHCHHDDAPLGLTSEPFASCAEEAASCSTSAPGQRPMPCYGQQADVRAMCECRSGTGDLQAPHHRPARLAGQRFPPTESGGRWRAITDVKISDLEATQLRLPGKSDSRSRA